MLHEKICAVSSRTRMILDSGRRDAQPGEACKNGEIEGLMDLSFPFSLTPKQVLTDRKFG